MALVKISGLAPITSLTPDSDVIPCVHDGITKKITLRQIFDASQFQMQQYKAFYYNTKDIVTSENMPDNVNAQSLGPVNIVNGVVINIPSSSIWYIT